MMYRAYAAVELQNPFLNVKSMRILRVVGLGLAIIMIRFLVPEVFRALENTLLTFFDTLDIVLTKSQTGITSASLIQLLPQ